MSSDHRLTPEERAAKLAAAHHTLKDGLASLKSSEGYRAYLAFLARFHHYSAGNVLMILQQRPHATHVAGFKAWKDLNRFVRKGEPGIVIWAPAFRQVENEDGTTDTLKRFRLTYVWDVSQTDGEPLPSLVSTLDGQDQTGRAALELARQATLALGFSLGFALMPEDPANGRYHRQTRSILVQSDRPVAQQAKTLIHELAHGLTTDQLIQQQATYDQAELVAESVAFVVSDYLGLDTSSYSLGYLASWGADPDALERVTDLVADTSKSIIEAIEGPQQNGAAA